MNTALFQHLAVVSKALSHANRLQILEHLTQRPYSVEELANTCGMNIANTSQHLQQLKHANLVKRTPIGQKAVYEIKDAKAYEIISSLSQFCLHFNPEVVELRRKEQVLSNSIKLLNMYKLFKKLGKKPQLIVDARSESEYLIEHIQGAISLHDQAQIDNAKNQTAVVYGRSILCSLAFQGAAKLEAQGFSVKRLDGGFAEWKMAQLPIFRADYPGE